jgi:hypothetical protein
LLPYFDGYAYRVGNQPPELLYPGPAGERVLRGNFQVLMVDGVVAGPVRENYLVGPRDTGDAASWRTEIGCRSSAPRPAGAGDTNVPGGGYGPGSRYPPPELFSSC